MTKNLSKFLLESMSMILPPIVKEVPVHGSHSTQTKMDGLIMGKRETMQYLREGIYDDLPHINGWKYEGIEGADTPTTKDNIHSDYWIEIGAESSRKKDLESQDFSQKYPWDSLHQYERENLRRYTDESYYLNKHLINKKEDPSLKTGEELRNMMSHIDNALASHKTPHALTVYHGAAFDPDEYARKNPERHLVMPSYISTSTNRSTATKFGDIKEHWYTDDNGEPGIIEGRHILQIEVPEGYPGFFLGPNSMHKSEHEFLMPRSTILQVDEKPQMFYRGLFSPSEKQYGKPLQYIWKAKPVGFDNR